MEKVEFVTVMSKVANRLMNNIQMGLSYKSWSPEFAYKEVKESYEKTKKELTELFGEIDTLPADVLKSLGFKHWEKESDLLLVPLWAFDMLPDGIELTSISGEKAVKGKDEIDLDVRFGCIAFGFVPKATESTEQAQAE